MFFFSLTGTHVIYFGFLSHTCILMDAEGVVNNIMLKLGETELGFPQVL